jgi:hypothetical protein
MITLLLHLFRLLPVLCGSHRHLALENLALRQQLAVYKKTLRRPKLHPSDRLFWICLSRMWAEWRQALIIVTPDTVLRWHRRRFRDYWTKLSRTPRVALVIDRAAPCRRSPDTSIRPASGIVASSARPGIPTTRPLLRPTAVSTWCSRLEDGQGKLADTSAPRRW